MRRPAGRETWNRLREWDRGQADSERLASRLLATQGFEAIDPSHPLGGRDGGMDIKCRRDGDACIVCVYFPRGQKAFSETLEKFKDDYGKTASSGAQGFVFFTNQELTLSERSQLEDHSSSRWIEIFHLERIASCLDSPNGYGLRLEFLQIEMTKEEQISFINDRDQILADIYAAVTPRPKRHVEHKIKTVQVQQPDFSGTSISVFGSKLVECKKCEEVFRANRSPLSVAYTTSFEVVTCPNCGHTQRFN